MALLLTNASFRRLWSAGFFFLLATWSLYTAVPLLIYRETGSALASGTVLAVIAVPGILLGPVAGVLVDRWDRRQVMRWGAVALAGVMLVAIPFADGASLAVLYAIVLLEAMVYAFFSPAESALLPTLVEETDLNAANSLNGLNDNLARIVGPVIGAVVLARFGFEWTLACCAALYGLGWLVLYGLKARSTNAAAADLAPDTDVYPDAGHAADPVGIRGFARSVWRELRAGVATVGGNRPLLVVMLVRALIIVADIPLSAVLPAFVVGSLDAGEEGYGTIVSVRGVAGLLGGLLIASIGHRLHERTLVMVGAATVGAGVVAIGLTQSFVATLVVMVVLGPAIAAMQTGISTLLQKNSEDATRGRVFGLLGTGSGLITLVASPAAGALAELSGPPVIVVASGVLYLLAVVLIVAAFRNRTAASVL